ncbi:MAG: cbb3-type cytochrome c oxidase N-terminal domain-containing protein [Bacteroidales bacterium]
MDENITDKINETNKQEENHEHEYDGIKELNNPSPMWVILLFLVTIGFSGIYAVKYFGYPNNGMDQVSEYKSSIEDQKLKMSQTADSKAGSLPEPAMIAEGEKLFKGKGCIACHGQKGEGNAIGPNLCDNFWINGCKTEEIILIISEGKSEKGMTPFKSTLTASQIKQLAVYIQKSLSKSKPENGKTAQGIECK